MSTEEEAPQELALATGSSRGHGCLKLGGSVPSPVRFAVVRKLLEQHGWVLVRISASHHVFKKPGAEDVVIPVHGGKVKPFYVRQVAKITQAS